MWGFLDQNIGKTIRAFTERSRTVRIVIHVPKKHLNVRITEVYGCKFEKKPGEKKFQKYSFTADIKNLLFYTDSYDWKKTFIFPFLK